MKRSKEDGGYGPPGKRQNGAGNGETNAGRPAPQPANAPRLTAEDAIVYLKRVKEKFKDDKVKYDEFLDCMKDFKAGRLDTAGVIGHVKRLFAGHRELILGFNAFLPNGYEIQLAPEPEQGPERGPVDFKSAITYVNKIKARFIGDEAVYKNFLEILNLYRKGSKSIAQVYTEVAGLFRDHDDLLKEFCFFLPDNSAPGGIPSIKASGLFRQHVPNGVDRTPFGTSKGHKERPPKKEKEKLNHGDPYGKVEKSGRGDRDSDRKDMVKKERREMKVKDEDKDEDKEKEKDKKRERERERELHKVKEEVDDEDTKLHPKRKSARRAEESNRRHAEGGVGGMGDKVSPPERKLKGSDSLLPQFLERVKVRARSQYQDFLKLLATYAQGVMTEPSLDQAGARFFSGQPELATGWRDVLSGSPNIDQSIAEAVGARKSEGGEGPAGKKKADRIRDREGEKEGDREGVREKGVKELGHKSAFGSHKERMANYKSISELDLSNARVCTPSYRMLPPNYAAGMTSHRTELGAQVLNDKWVSVTSGSEDYSFKHMRKNQYEESLFRCEDDRFELDMLLQSTTVTVKKVEDLVESMQHAKEGGGDRPPLKVEDLSAINLRCVERIYGDHGLDIQDLLKRNPHVALPVVLARLKQKREEWARCQLEMNKVWKEVYSKNYHKSLDHRSFYFKQQDKKALSGKGLLAEIKELNETKRRDDDETLLAIAAGNRRPLLPDIRVEYPDLDVHDDVLKMLRFSAEEMYNSVETSEKIMRIYLDFVEKAIGVPERATPLAESEPVSPDKVTENGVAEKPAQETDTVDPPDLVGKPGGPSAPRIVSVEGDERGVDGEEAEVGEKEGGSGQVGAGPDSDTPPEQAGAESKVEDKSNGDANVEESPPKVEGVVDKGVEEEVLGVAEGGEGPVGEVPGVAEGEVAEGRGGEGQIEEEEEEEEKEGDAVPTVEEPAREESEGGRSSSVESDSVSEVEHEQVEEAEHENEIENENEGEEEEEDMAKGESEGEAEGDVDMDEAGETNLFHHPDDKVYDACKPLAAYALDPRSLLVAAHSSEKRVFFGNDAFYIFFRLHQAFYQRLHCAKVNAAASEEKWKSSKQTNVPDLYLRFQDTLLNLLDGTIEHSKYEDECRAIIGTQSYVLFTLDKVVFKLVKQLMSIQGDDTCIKLLALHAYEQSRQEGSADSVYYANARVLLPDENVYRFEHKGRGVSPGELTIQLMEDGGEPLESRAGFADPAISDYLDHYLNVAPQLGRDVHGVFLNRNKSRIEKEKGDGMEEARALRGTSVYNSLECRLACTGYKVNWMLDTEDVFHRHKNKKATKSVTEEEREVRFCNWVASKEKELSLV